MVDTSNIRRIGIAELLRRTGKDGSTLWRWYKAEPPEFPRPHYIGNRRAWFEAEIEEWEREQMARSPETIRHNLQPRGVQ